MQSVGPDSVFIGRREQFVALASCFAVPAVYSFRSFTASGGLMSYVKPLLVTSSVFMRARSAAAPNRPICRSATI
jgi:hypothetical protein